MSNWTKRFFFIFSFLISHFSFLIPIHAQVKFENPQINADSKFLFTVSHNLGGTIPYKTLFLADATKTDATKIITCFPERMEMLAGGSVLQVRNRYGSARYSVADSTLSWISREEKQISASFDTMAQPLHRYSGP